MSYVVGSDGKAHWAAPAAQLIVKESEKWIKDDRTAMLMLVALQAAVPMWQIQLARSPWNHIAERAQICAQAVAEKGDVLQFRSKRKGETAEAFNRLAEGLACLSFAPGGVRFLGVRWTADHRGGDNG